MILVKSDDIIPLDFVFTFPVIRDYDYELNVGIKWELQETQYKPPNKTQ